MAYTEKYTDFHTDNLKPWNLLLSLTDNDHSTWNDSRDQEVKKSPWEWGQEDALRRDSETQMTEKWS